MKRPKRIQLSRRKGWRLPPNTVNVARPSKWGNPFRVQRSGKGWCVVRPNGTETCEFETRLEAARCAVDLFGYWLDTPHGLALCDHLPDLRGKKLACWCKLSEPCHADALIALANIRT